MNGEHPIGIAERALMLAHLPERPSWNCAADGEPWPCLVAKVTLKLALTDTTLRVAMSAFAHCAVEDLVPLTFTTYDRFYRWINDRTIQTLTRTVGVAPVPPSGDTPESRVAQRPDAMPQ